MKKKVILSTLLTSVALLSVSATSQAATSNIKKEHKKVTVVKNDVKLYKDSKMKSYSKVKKGTVYQVNGYRNINGKHVYRIYQTDKNNKQQYKGYIINKDTKDFKSSKASGQYIAKKGVTLWNNFYWNNKKSVTNEEKVYFVKSSYTLGDGSKYFSVYYKDAKGKDVWAGYTNASNVKTLKATEETKYITLNKNYETWNNLYFKQHKDKFTASKGINFKVKRYYILNGCKFYSTYRTDASGKEIWTGYVNGHSSVVKDLKGKKVATEKQSKQVVKNSYSYDYFMNKKQSIKSGEIVTAKYDYTYGNNNQYYSVYNHNQWLGYVNSKDLIDMESFESLKDEALLCIDKIKERLNEDKVYVVENELLDIKDQLEKDINDKNIMELKKDLKEVKLLLSDKEYAFDLSDWTYEKENDGIKLLKYNGNSKNITIPGELLNKQIHISTVDFGNQVESLSILPRNGKKVILDNSKMKFNEELKYLNISGLDTKNVTNMAYAFYYVSKIQGLENLNTSNVTDMSGMFKNSKISSLKGLENWDTSNVTDMSNMFSNSYITSLKELKNWNISKVDSLYGMFADTDSIQSLEGLENWNLSNVTDTSAMFYGCIKLNNIDALKNWDTSNITDMSQMFEGALITNIDALNKWNTSNVTNMKKMFEQCHSLLNIDGMKSWDMSNVEDTRLMFDKCSKLADISGILNKKWNKEINDYGIFMGCINIPDDQSAQYYSEITAAKNE